MNIFPDRRRALTLGAGGSGSIVQAIRAGEGMVHSVALEIYTCLSVSRAGVRTIKLKINS